MGGDHRVSSHTPRSVCKTLSSGCSTRTGPYCNRKLCLYGDPDADDGLKNDYVSHPGPYQDGIEMVYNPNEKWVFGTLGIQQTRTWWFSREDLEVFHRHGYGFIVSRLCDVGDHIRRGQSQVYYRGTDQFVTIECTDLYLDDVVLKELIDDKFVMNDLK